MDTAREEKYKSTLKAARDTIRELAQETESLRRSLAAPNAPVAIVGMAGEFPGDGSDAESFRRMLLDGMDASGEIPSSRWDHERYYSSEPGLPGKYYCSRASFLSRDPFAFDHEFFGLSRSEAEMMDPQQRILLTQSHHALEDAGIPPSSLQGTDTGVFLGVSSFDHMMTYATPDIETRSDPYALTGAAFNSASGRLSYFYDIHGPCMAVDTACSSSLIAILAAVEALRKGECPIALAGGVNLLLSPLSFVALCAIRALSADGLCRAFGEGATGFGRGEGCGIVVLKRLDHAQAAGDRIHAVILGGASGHDGQSAGFTAPSGVAQRRIIERAMRDAGVAADDVAYIETHGTGTDLGDPIEASSLSDTFGKRKRKLLIGSVKSNIGHLEAAAGIAALFKTIFAVRDGEIPPSLHADTRSPRIEWQSLDIDVCRKRSQWPEGYARRIAGVSSFGISGTGAHIIVTAPPDVNLDNDDAAESPDRPDWIVLPVSARNGDSLAGLVEAYMSKSYSKENEFYLTCGKAALGRDHFSHRVAVAASDAAVAGKALGMYSEGKRNRDVVAGTAGKHIKIAFLFSGQGSQIPGMGRELYRTNQVFRDTMNACDRIASSRLGQSLCDVMFGDDAGLLNRTLFTQPALYAMGAALSDMWRSFGIRPSVVVGHSIGEYAAAYTAKVFTLEEGMNIVLERARLADGITKTGMMAAVLAGEDTARRFIAGTEADIAAVNGADNVTISGPSDTVADICMKMRASGIEFRELPVSQAFHSPLIEPVLGEFGRFISGCTFAAPKVRFISSMTASELTGKTDWRSYWTDQMRKTVRFGQALDAIGDVNICLEIGASPTLTSLCRTANDNWLWLFSQGPGIPPWKQISLSLARLYVSGCTIDFSGGMLKRSSHANIPLYPFRETVLRPPQPKARSDEQQPAPADIDIPDSVSADAVRRIMKMQVTSMKRLFERQLDTLGRLSIEEHEPHE